MIALSEKIPATIHPGVIHLAARLGRSAKDSENKWPSYEAAKKIIAAESESPAEYESAISAYCEEAGI